MEFTKSEADSGRMYTVHCKSGIHNSVSVSYRDLEARLEPLGGRGDVEACG